MLLGGGLIVNTTLYHILVRGEAEVLALGNLYLMIGFLAAIPWGGWPQLAIALAACAGLAVGTAHHVQASVSSGILLSGMVSLGGLSVASAVLTDRYRYGLFLAQEQLQTAKEAAEHASQARRDFVASVSHDLRTPVNIIFGMADMALDVAVTAEQRELVETIKRSAGQLHALLNDLVDFSKIDAGVVDLAPRRFAAAAVARHGARGPDARDAAAKRPAAARRRSTRRCRTSIVSDPDRLRQVLGNLVGNAVKFTDAGEVTVRLRVTDSPGRPPRPALRGARHRHRHRRRRVRPPLRALRAGGGDQPLARRQRPRPRRSANASPSRWAAPSASTARSAAAAPSGSGSRSTERGACGAAVPRCPFRVSRSARSLARAAGAGLRETLNAERGRRHSRPYRPRVAAGVESGSRRGR